MTAKRQLDKSDSDQPSFQPSLVPRATRQEGTYITHTPYYTLEFPLQAQTALDAYFRRGEALPREAVAQLAQVWRAIPPVSPLTKGGWGDPFWDWVAGLAPRARVYIPRMPR